MENEPKDDFYAVVSALTRFIETADEDISPASSNRGQVAKSRVTTATTENISASK